MAFDKNHMTTPMKIVVVVFAVILVVSLMLPSLAALFGHSSKSVQQQEQSQQVQKTPQTYEEVSAQYQPALTDLEQRLSENKESVALQENLANVYFKYASEVLAYAQDDTNHDKARALFKKSVEAYDKLMDKNPTKELKAGRLVALWYSGDKQASYKGFDELIKEDPQFALAYIDLGLLHEADGEDKLAQENYDKAVEIDKDGKLGLKQFVESRRQLKELQEKLKQAPAADDKASQEDKKDSSTQAPSKESKGK